MCTQAHRQLIVPGMRSCHVSSNLPDVTVYPTIRPRSHERRTCVRAGRRLLPPAHTTACSCGLTATARRWAQSAFAVTLRLELKTASAHCCHAFRGHHCLLVLGPSWSPPSQPQVAAPESVCSQSVSRWGSNPRHARIPQPHRGGSLRALPSPLRSLLASSPTGVGDVDKGEVLFSLPHSLHVTPEEFDPVHGSQGRISAPIAASSRVGV